MKQEQEKPQKLYRMVKLGGLRFDSTGSLLPHRKQTALQGFFYKGSVPMVTEEDIEYIEGYFGADENFLRLTIESAAVENLRSSRHGNLKGLEYFGVVKKAAIVNSEMCKKK